MAKKRSRPDRDAPGIASQRLAPVYVPVSVTPAFRPAYVPPANLDRRSYYPKAYRPPVSTSGGAVRVVVPRVSKSLTERSLAARYFRQPKASGRIPSRLEFRSPRSVLVCVRRRQRREVLFAKKRTRSGRGSRKRRSVFSNIGC